MKKLLLGNEAIARGAYEAGVRVVSSYPGTPSTEITEYAATYDEMYVEWGPNEKVSMEVAVGASVAGGRAMTAMKHVGLNVAADPLFTASYTGVNGGLVVCVADDQGMHSSQNEQDSRNYAYSAKIPMLEPSDSAECREFVKTAFELSEDFDTPVLIRLSTRVSHSRSLAEIADREERPLKPYEKNPRKYVMMPAMAKLRHGFVEERMIKLKSHSESTAMNRIERAAGSEGQKIGIIAAGIAYQYAKEALGDAVSYCKLGMIHPLPDQLLADFVQSVDICYVIEELDPFIENHCKKLGLPVIGKEHFSLQGEYTAAMIRKAILSEETEGMAIQENVPARPPVMCAGCPHRSVFHVLNQLKLTVSGDIGCYTLGALAPLQAIDTCVCMGASISMAHGMEKAAGREFSKKTVAVIGDSTFIHSGITGLIDIVYNKGASTVIILDNSITGMTGHQDNPTTGKTIKGEPTVQVDLKKLCEAIGVRRVVVTDPFDAAGFQKIVKEETAADEPSVIIAQRPCALLKSVKYDHKYEIAKENCRECGLCQRIGCPAISKSESGTIIDSTQCAGCGYCVNICPFSAIQPVGKEVL